MVVFTRACLPYFDQEQRSLTTPPAERKPLWPTFTAAAAQEVLYSKSSSESTSTGCSLVKMSRSVSSAAIWKIPLYTNNSRSKVYGAVKKHAFSDLCPAPRRPQPLPYDSFSPMTSPIFKQVVFCFVFFPSILDIKFVGRTSRGHTGGRSHRIFNPPSFCGACLDFCREKDSELKDSFSGLLLITYTVYGHIYYTLCCYPSKTLSAPFIRRTLLRFCCDMSSSVPIRSLPLPLCFL